MSAPVKPETDAEVRCWYEGMRAGIRLYAINKSGGQVVGCGVYTLAQAIADVDKAERASRSLLERTGEPWPGCFSPRTG